jgi:hypothetical protein
MPERTFKIFDFGNPDWFKDKQEGSIWVSCYRAFRILEESIPEGIKTLDFGDLRVVFLSGSLKYYDSNNLRIQFETETQWKVDASDFKERDTPKGIYTLFVVPFDKGSTPGSEATTRAMVSAYLGLLAAFQGRNVVHHRIFESIFLFPGDKVSNVSPVVVNPFAFPAPNLSDAAFKLISMANRNMHSLDELQRNRVVLSLRWFEQALFELGGVDAFLKFWIAVETVGMPDTSNIRPLVESLASAYCETSEDIKSKYKIGRLFDLRSRIVHEGSIMPIHSGLLKYLEALYVDALYQFLGITSERRLEQVTNIPGFDVMTYLPK